MKGVNFLFNKPLTGKKHDDYAKKIDNLLKNSLKFIQTPQLFAELLHKLATKQKSFSDKSSSISPLGKSNIEKLLELNERKPKNEKYKTKKTIFFNKLRISLEKFKDNKDLDQWREREFLNFCDYLDGVDIFETKSS